MLCVLLCKMQRSCSKHQVSSSCMSVRHPGMLSDSGSTQTHGLPGDTFTSPEYSTDSVDSQNHTKLSSEDVEEESKHQGSKVSNASPFRHMQSLVTAHQDVTCASCTLTTQALSQSTGEGSGPPREPDIAKVKGECRMNSAFNAALRIPVSSERKQVYHINTLNSS